MAAADPCGAAAWHPPAPRRNDHHYTDPGRVRVIDARPAGRHARDRAQAWLRSAVVALGVLAAAAAAVSWDAQYVLVASVKRNMAVAALEAGIPDVGALIFAALGVALALHGKLAIRARVLNVACVAISLAMNALASSPGWRDLAIWVMPSAVYALASDTFIGVIRAWVIARERRSGPALADEATPVAIVGGLFLWLLRLTLAPPSTMAGFRRWALDECPVAPGRKAERPTLPSTSRQAREPQDGRRPPAGGPGKQSRLLAVAGERHDLKVLPLRQVSGIANQIGAEVDLSPGTARRVLLAHVRALQNGNGQEGIS